MANTNTSTNRRREALFAGDDFCPIRGSFQVFLVEAFEEMIGGRVQEKDVRAWRKEGQRMGDDGRRALTREGPGARFKLIISNGCRAGPARLPQISDSP